MDRYRLTSFISPKDFKLTFEHRLGSQEKAGAGDLSADSFPADGPGLHAKAGQGEWSCSPSSCNQVLFFPCLA